MTRATVVKLVADTPAAHGAFETPTSTTTRTVMARAMSIGMNESYAAHSAGLKPEIKFKLALAEEYQGEKILKYDDGNGEADYRIIRTYVAGDGIELTCERWGCDV